MRDIEAVEFLKKWDSLSANQKKLILGLNNDIMLGTYSSIMNHCGGTLFKKIELFNEVNFLNKRGIISIYKLNDMKCGELVINKKYKVYVFRLCEDWKEQILQLN